MYQGLISRFLENLFLHDGVPKRMRGRQTVYFQHKPQVDRDRKPHTVAEYDSKGIVTFRDPTQEENPDFYNK